MSASRPPEEIAAKASAAPTPGARDREMPAHEPALREGPAQARPSTRAEQPPAELALLADVSIQLLAAPRPETLLRELLARLAQLLRLDFALNYLLDDVLEDARLRLNASVGVDEDTRVLLEFVRNGEGIC